MGRRFWIIISGFVFLLCVGFIVTAYYFGWPGTGFTNKTLWDWLQLLMDTRWNDTFGAEYIQAAKQRAPLKQATKLEDAAAAYVMLARNESITGQIITVDSGLTL